MRNRPIAVISHERSGTHLTMDTLRNCFSETFRRQRPFQNVRHLFFDLEARLRKGEDALDAIRNCPVRPIVKTHVLPDLSNVPGKNHDTYREVLEISDRIYVERDGRDVMVSFFQFSRLFRDYRGTFSGFIRERNRETGVTPVAYWANHVRTWLAQPDIHHLQYRMLTDDLPSTLSSLASAMNLTLLRQRRVETVENRWLRAVQRAIGMQSSSAILPGSGGSDKWMSVFSEDDIEFFETESEGLLAALGYLPQGHRRSIEIADTPEVA